MKNLSRIFLPNFKDFALQIQYFQGPILKTRIYAFSKIGLFCLKLDYCRIQSDFPEEFGPDR